MRERKHESKTVNQTFSMAIEVAKELHTYVKSIERSCFVIEALRRELEAKKKELRKAYLAANKDADQRMAQHLSKRCGRLVGISQGVVKFIGLNWSNY